MPTKIKISAQFATSLHSPEHIAIAEHLGYERAWLFDNPHEDPDVWMMLALAAQRTTTIGLGPGVLVPTLRHPMVNASATAFTGGAGTRTGRGRIWHRLRWCPRARRRTRQVVVCTRLRDRVPWPAQW